MEKKATPLDLNLPPNGSIELNNSRTSENLVSHGRMHDDASTDGGLLYRRLMTRDLSHSDFEFNSIRELNSNQFQRSVQNASDNFWPYDRGVTATDDGSTAGRCQFDGLQAPWIRRTYPTLEDANTVAFEYYNQGDPINSNMMSGEFQLVSLPMYPEIPVTGSGTTEGMFQFGGSHGTRLERVGPGLLLNEHERLRYNNQGEDVNANLVPNALQLGSFNSSQTSGSLNLCGGLVSGFQSDREKHNCVGLNQSNDHHRNLAHGSSLNFRDEHSAASMIQSGNHHAQELDFQYNQSSIIPGIGSEPHTGYGPNIDDWNAGGIGFDQQNLLGAVPTGRFMHVRSINPMVTSNIMQNLPMGDQHPLQMMQNGGSYIDATHIGASNNRFEDAVHGLAGHILGASVSASNFPHQFFPSPVQRYYQRSMTASVVDPLMAQKVGQHCLHGQITRPSNTNFGNTNYHSVTGQHAVSYSRGTGGSSLALQGAACTHTRASDVAAVDLFVPASGNSSLILGGMRNAQTPPGGDARIQSLERMVAHAYGPGQVTGRASGQTLLKCGKSHPGTRPSNSVQRKAAYYGRKNMKPVASNFRQLDVIRPNNTEASVYASSISRYTPLGARCDLCNIDLAFIPGPSGAASPSEDPPMAAVLACGHRFHDSCLREVGVSTEACKEPSCVVCGSTEQHNVRS